MTSLFRETEIDRWKLVRCKGVGIKGSTIVASYVPSIFRCFNRMVRWFIFWKCATNFWLLGLGKSARYLPLWVRFIPSKTAGNSSKEVVMCIKIVEQGIFLPKPI